MREVLYNAVFHVAQPNGCTLTGYTPAVEIQLKVANADNRGVLTFSAANQRLTSGDKLTHVKRLADVVVGSRIEQGDHGFLLVAGGQDENRRLGAKLSVALE